VHCLRLNTCILIWFRNKGHIISSISYKLPFLVWTCSCVWNCMLELGSISHGTSLTHHIFRKKSLTFYRWPFLFLTKCMIWHCFLSCYYQCFNCLFHFKVFLVLFQHINLFKKKIFKRQGFVHENWNFQCMHKKKFFKKFRLRVLLAFRTQFVFRSGFYQRWPLVLVFFKRFQVFTWKQNV